MKRSIAALVAGLAAAPAGAYDIYGGFGGSSDTGSRIYHSGHYTASERADMAAMEPGTIRPSVSPETRAYGRSYASPSDYARYSHAPEPGAFDYSSREYGRIGGGLPNIYGGFQPSPDLEW